MVRATRVVLLAVALAGAAADHAAARVELRVSPVVANVEAAAGETVTQDVMVTASGDEPIAVEFRHVDFGFDDVTYETRIIRDEAPETTAFSTRGWFSVPRPRYDVAAGATVTVPVRISVPPNTPGGTYLGGAFLRVVPAAAGDGSQVQAVAETGPLLFIRIAGGEPPKPSIDRFAIPGRTTRGPVTPRIVVANHGDDFFTYEGAIRLTGPGKDDSVAVARQYVVPGEPRVVRTAPGTTGTQGRPTLGSRSLGFGQYRVTARLRIEPTGTTLVETRSFWVVPTWMRVLAAVLAVVLAASLALLGRWLYLRLRRPEPVDDVVPLDEDDEDPDGDGDDPS